jgi:hypothetical protein
MPLTDPPEIPLITEPSTFSQRAQDWVVWQADELYPFLTDSAALLGLSASATSTTSNTIGTGSKSFTVQTGKGFIEGMSLSIARTSAPTNRMFCVVVSYNSGTGALVVTSQAFEGSGTFTDWSIAPAFNGSISLGQLPDGLLTADATGRAKMADDYINAAKLADSSLGFGMINGKIVASVNANALTVAVKTFAGNDPSASDPVLVLFRNATLTDGSYSVVSITAATSLVVSSGSTLGTIASILANLVVVIINNAGTAELAISNMAGGVNLDGTGVISTTAEGGAGGADSAIVVYSTTARSNVAYRPVALMEITEATPGTWATAHTKLTPISAPQSLMSLGSGQVGQFVTRVAGTTYYNTTGKPIYVNANITSNASANGLITVTQNGVSVIYLGAPGAAGNGLATSAIIPPGASYVFTTNAGTPTVGTVIELR